MRILIVSQFFPPQAASASNRVRAIAIACRRAGHEVTVLTTAKTDEQVAGPVHDARPLMPGIRVIEVPVRPPALLESARGRFRRRAEGGSIGPSSDRDRGLAARLRERTGIFASARMPDRTDWWIRPARRRAEALARREGAFDVVLSSSGPYTTHLVARGLVRRGAARRHVADFRDAWTDNQPFGGLPPFTLLERHLERGILRHADLVTTVSAPIADRLARRRGAPVEVVPNGWDDDEPPADLAALPEPLRSTLGRDGLVRLVFTGTVYPRAQRLELPFAALGRLDASLRRRFRVTVAGPADDPWAAAARAAGAADRLEAIGPVPRAGAIALQRAADALLLIAWSDPAAGVLTGKLFEYLRRDAPILVCGDGPGDAAATLVAQTGRGRASGTDPDTLAGLLRDLADGRPLAPHPDRERIAALARPVTAGALVADIERMAAERNGPPSSPRAARPAPDRHDDRSTDVRPPAPTSPRPNPAATGPNITVSAAAAGREPR